MGLTASVAPIRFVSQGSDKMGILKRSNTVQSKSFALSSSSKDEHPSIVESLKALCKSDGGRRACLKYYIQLGSGPFFHVFCIVLDFNEASTNNDLLVMLSALNEQVQRETSMLNAYCPEWQRISDFVTAQSTATTTQNLRRTISCVNDIVVRKLCSEFDGLVNSETYRSWELTVSQQERQLYIPPVRKGLVKYGSCPNPRSTVHVKVAKATSWIGDPTLDTTVRVKNFATVFQEILVIDDSLVSTKLSGKSLQKDGHTVRTALNGKAGYEMSQVKRYDIIIVDIFMPIMDGYATLELLSSNANQNGEPTELGDAIDYESPIVIERWNHAPILIAMSADDDNATVQHAFSSGADYFLCKPLTIERLADLLL